MLSCAAKIAVEEGQAGVTVQAVAQAAGVSKGGLFHHFANKQALVESMTPRSSGVGMRRWRAGTGSGPAGRRRRRRV
ncbi:TetR/AcrR family transcriptional regulator [Massilia scottii]|uniref:TetR/AcrR family transcriptional regulator n=1 Tax=Massilia scottii TaxID=3057166 RepID=UPI0027969933|nr:helix-turn-helix domain-containing protein [Massilia sp. CCM 9029]MDQ1833378.1 helix-turn-helix domain-containing protein [Massilia sp. CCM 9029]